MFSSDPSLVFARRRVAPSQATPWAPTPFPMAAEPTSGEPEEDAVDAAALAVLEREQELEETYARGYAEGAEEARRQDAERVRSALAALSAAAEAVRAAEAGRLDALHEHLCALSVAVAQQVVGRELRADPQVVTELVRRAVAEFPVDQTIRVRLNPADLSSISAMPTDAAAVPVAPGREVTWIPDPAIARGGCVVEGRERILDGRVDLALERIYRTLAQHD